MSFFQHQEAILIATAALWMIQSLLALPNKLPYDGSKINKSAAIKIYISLTLINLFGVYIVKVTEVPNVVQYFHWILAILPLIAVYLILNDEIEITKS